MRALDLFLVLLCVAFLVIPTGGFGHRRLCGIQLVEALLFVCGKKGLFYQPGRRTREKFEGTAIKNSGAYSQEVIQTVFRLTRGIVEQCCHFYCDYYDLENYCNT